jgi:iron complex transport system ATP-binding protein
MDRKNSRSNVCLRVEGLKIERDQNRIIHDLTWQVQRGEHWCILGANGSGKTSLLRALTGYFMPTAGEIFLLGHQYGEADWRDVRLELGIVSSAVRQMMADSEPAVISVVSGKYAMIDYWGEPLPEDLKLARRILKQVECLHLEERPWAYLSQGERQRVLIGRALMAKPSLMILDEPCAGLDPGARENFLQFLQRLGSKRQAPTTIIVTHHVEEIMPVFTHVLMLQDGRVLCSGEKAKVMNSKNLSTLFSAKATLRQQDGRYSLAVSAHSQRVA